MDVIRAIRYCFKRRDQIPFIFINIFLFQDILGLTDNSVSSCTLTFSLACFKMKDKFVKLKQSLCKIIFSLQIQNRKLF